MAGTDKYGFYNCPIHITKNFAVHISINIGGDNAFKFYKINKLNTLAWL